VLTQDLRYAVRMMRKAPMFTIAIVLTGALTIAGSTAIFGVVNAVLVRPLPFAQPETLVQVAEKNDSLHLPSFGASALNFLSWKDLSRSVEGLSAVGFSTFNLTGSGEPEQFTGSTMSASLMPVLGLQPVAGRRFTDADDKPGATPVAIISAAIWKRRFGGDRAVVGQHVTLNGIDTTIVGVAPPALAVLTGGDIWIPIAIDSAKEIRLNHVVIVVGRLKRGVTIAQAQGEMDVVAGLVARDHPEIQGWGIHLVAFDRWLIADSLRTSLLVLLGAVGLVLLIACANIANLLLARAAAREKEMAVRVAVGAGRGRLLRQLIVESVALSAAGGAIGLVGAVWAVKAINGALPPNLLPVPDVTIDARVLAFGVGITFGAGLLFGLAPAWHAASPDVSAVLKQSGRSLSGGRSALRNGLAAAEIALATVLLIGAGLLVQSLLHLQRVHLGFDPERVMTFQLSLPAAKYPADKAPRFYQELTASLRAVPGVLGAGVSSGIPFGAGSYTRSPFTTTGPSAVPPDTAIAVDWRAVSDGFFRTMRVPLLRGREFTDADTRDAPQVVIVSQATARAFWGDADPIGRELHRADKRSWTVVGVVGEVRNTALNQEAPTLYFPTASRVFGLMDVVVRVAGAPESVLPTLRRKVHDLDPELALANVRPMTEWVAASAAQPQLNAALLAGFAAVALLIAAIGIYGVIAYSVSLRTREIGVRLALGAQPSGVLRHVIGEGMVVAGAGIGAGIAGAFAIGRALESIVFEVRVKDPATFATVAVALALVALAASIIPARRAARVDPLVALRDE